MSTYISILRGINVSGQKLIKMNRLREMYDRLGFQNSATYVQSGNVVFNAPGNNPKDLEQKISDQLHKDFGFDVPVIVLTVEQLEKIINNNPFVNDRDKDPAHFYVTFLSSEPDTMDSESIERKKQTEEICFTNRAVYLYCPAGYGKTKLNNNFLESKLKVTATTRNWKSTNKLHEMAIQINTKNVHCH